jgi:hypothetical protein
MNVPGPPEGDQIATLPKPLLEQDQAAYSALSVDTWPAVSNLSALLEAEPFDLSTTYIGPARVTPGQIFIKAQGRYWLLERNRVEFTPCEYQAIEVIVDAGYKFDSDHIRFAHRMPRGWHPSSTMREVAGCPRVYRGPVTTEGCSIALGFAPNRPVVSGQGQWAAWVAVHVGRLVFS